jgi:hypothetical protein
MIQWTEFGRIRDNVVNWMIQQVPLTGVTLGAGVTFDWLFFDNSKLIDFD